MRNVHNCHRDVTTFKLVLTQNVCDATWRKQNILAGHVNILSLTIYLL